MTRTLNPGRWGSFVCLMLVGSYAIFGEQPCDVNQEVYQNQSLSAMVVTMEFTDACPDAESYVYVYAKDGSQLSKGTVPDMQTRSFTFDVPAAGNIRFNCRGTGHNSSGHCTSRLVSAFVK